MSHTILRTSACILTLCTYVIPCTMLATPYADDNRDAVDYDSAAATQAQMRPEEQYYDADQFQAATPQDQDAAGSPESSPRHGWSTDATQPDARAVANSNASSLPNDGPGEQARHEAQSPQASVSNHGQATHDHENVSAVAAKVAIAGNRAEAQSQAPTAPTATPVVNDGNQQNQDFSPWEQFLIYTISILHLAQSGIEHYFSVLLSKQGIPLLIITFGVLLLNIVIWFAYVSFKKEQSVKIKNLMRNKTAPQKPVADAPEPLALAYAEESSGDFDVFATSEGIPIKLDLAQAYLNMGEVDGAKEILIDIISQHRGKIVSAAQAMLKKIDDR